MKRKCCLLALVVSLAVPALLNFSPVASVRAESSLADTPRAELRGFWVDAFHDGIKKPEQVDKLISDALTANANALFVQVRRRGDAYYNLSPWEPRTDDPDLAPGFDALAYVVERAHAKNLEVHAWLSTLPAWNKETPPLAANHLWNLHGPEAQGSDNWVSYKRAFDAKSGTWSETLSPSYDLDPGNPAVIDHTVSVAANIVNKYDVDGVQLDLVRYAGLGSGYNTTSVARYNARYGTTGLPSPEDERWADWRREQVTNLVRRVYLEVQAIKPKVKVSAATIAWGAGPKSEADFRLTRAYAEVFQDWRSWLAEGIIDLAIPMNYDREWDGQQRLWYDQWLEWEKNHQYSRRVAVGTGAYMQYPEGGLEQTRRAVAPSTLGNLPYGVVLYSYASTSLFANESYANDQFFALLSGAGGYVDPSSGATIPTAPVFAAPTPAPDMPWKSAPAKGHLMGKVIGATAVDHLKLALAGPEKRATYTDGGGWFGFVDLAPGVYEISLVDGQPFNDGPRIVNIQSGSVSTLLLTLPKSP